MYAGLPRVSVRLEKMRACISIQMNPILTKRACVECMNAVLILLGPLLATFPSFPFLDSMSNNVVYPFAQCRFYISDFPPSHEYYEDTRVCGECGERVIAH